MIHQMWLIVAILAICVATGANTYEINTRQIVRGEPDKIEEIAKVMGYKVVKRLAKNKGVILEMPDISRHRFHTFSNFGKVERDIIHKIKMGCAPIKPDPDPLPNPSSDSDSRVLAVPASFREPAPADRLPHPGTSESNHGTCLPTADIPACPLPCRRCPIARCRFRPLPG